MLVVSSDVANRRGLVKSVVAGTDDRDVERDGSTNVRVPAAESGLPRDRVFLCFQIRSIDPVRFVDPARGAARRAGRLPSE